MFFKLTTLAGNKVRVNMDNVEYYESNIDNDLQTTVVTMIGSSLPLEVKETVEQIDRALTETYRFIKEIR